MQFASFLKSQFITDIVMNPQERKLSKRNEILRQLDDHRIVMKMFNDFNQNSGGQPNYSTI